MLPENEVLRKFFGWALTDISRHFEPKRSLPAAKTAVFEHEKEAPHLM